MARSTWQWDSGQYLVADLNPTGYPQVIDERRLVGPGVDRAYTWGLQLIAVRDFQGSTTVDHYYGTDGHGSVRFLTDSTGAITDTYDYDAFGNLISRTGTTTNNYLFAGEQFDPALGVYYNRARYYDQRVGRFWTRIRGRDLKQTRKSCTAICMDMRIPLTELILPTIVKVYW